MGAITVHKHFRALRAFFTSAELARIVQVTPLRGLSMKVPGTRSSLFHQRTTNEVSSVARRPPDTQPTRIGHLPGVVRVPTRHVQVTLPRRRER